MNEANLVDARDRTGTWGRPNRNRRNTMERFAYGRVLDIGCASDAYTGRLRERGLRTLSVDLLPIASPPPNFVRASADRLPFADNSVDTALLFEVLEHIPDPGSSLREIARVASRLILSVPNCSIDPSLPLTGLVPYHFTDRTHVNFFDAASLHDVLSDNGWRTIHLRHINPVSPGALSLRGWGCPISLLQVLAPLLKRLPRPHPLAMSLLAVADRSS